MDLEGQVDVMPPSEPDECTGVNRHGADGMGSIVGLGLALAARLRRNTMRRTPQHLPH
jgi:hypothetical protein